MRLHNYLIRLQTIIESRREIDASDLLILQPTRERGAIKARLRFYDGSFLELSEELEVKGDEVVKLQYSYHYQKGDRLIFRYDNAPLTLNCRLSPTTNTLTTAWNRARSRICKMSYGK